MRPGGVHGSQKKKTRDEERRKKEWGSGDRTALQALFRKRDVRKKFIWRYLNLNLNYTLTPKSFISYDRPAQFFNTDKLIFMTVLIQK